MSSKTQYRTKQREQILAFLENTEGRHVTVQEICDALRLQGTAIGTTTVYRQLERLIDEGLAVKYTVDGAPACFAYLHPESHGHANICYHGKCELCGCVLHLHCEEVEKLMTHVSDHHGFRIDPRRTVFYGICQNCQEH